MLRLKRQFGIHDVALECRSFRVIYGGSLSAMVHISVPQGSVFFLGLRLSILGNADLAEVVKKYDASIHAFANDIHEMAATVDCHQCC